MVESLHSRLGFDDSALSWVSDPEATAAASTVPVLERLAAVGLLSLGLDDGRHLDGQVAVVSALANRSMSVAFSAWAHRMVLEYVNVSGRHNGLLSALERTDLIGSTAMASALRATLGLERVGLSAVPESNGYLVRGRIPWASNLHTNRTLIVAAAEKPDGSHVVLGLLLDGKQVSASSAPSLLALQATASTGVVVADAKVPADRVISEDLETFLARVRPIFMLLQAAFAIGLGETALAALDVPLHGADTVLEADRNRLIDRHSWLVATTISALTGPGIAARDLLAYRLEASEFAQAAVAAEARKEGGRGFVASSATARRIREAAFLPIQSPTESQLRWELQCSA
jgi:alkylation response protein AidB-like acyl-CoA dehydrogenase